MADRGNACEVAKASISAIADLLSYFDGSTGDYENWELQLRLLKKRIVCPMITLRF